MEGEYTRVSQPTYLSNGIITMEWFAELFADMLQGFDWVSVLILHDSSSVPVYNFGANNMELALHRRNARVFRRTISKSTEGRVDFTEILSYFRERSRGGMTT